jgi:hypothetical protein
MVPNDKPDLDENVDGVKRLSLDHFTRAGPLFVTFRQSRKVEHEQAEMCIGHRDSQGKIKRSQAQL